MHDIYLESMLHEELLVTVLDNFGRLKQTIQTGSDYILVSTTPLLRIHRFELEGKRFEVCSSNEVLEFGRLFC